MRRLVGISIASIILFGMGIVYAIEDASIEIIPLGEIDNFILEYLKDNLSGIFNAQIHVKGHDKLPEYAYNKIRGQYLSSKILNNLPKPQNNLQKTLAIINKDLYIPKLNFVFGQADPQKGVCIISIARLDQLYYVFKQDRDLLLKRALKEAVHELGHLFNLGHCQNPLCVMHLSHGLSETDRKDYRFCDNCKKVVVNAVRGGLR